MKKIQTTISEDDERKLNQIINVVGLNREDVISQPQYIRELITSHIQDYDGMTNEPSFINEEVKRLIQELNEQNK